MCKVYNQIGCLTDIRAHLRESNIIEYNSINQLISFQKDYPFKRQQIISDYRVIIEKEKMLLSNSLKELEIHIGTTTSDTRKRLQLEIDELEDQVKSLDNSSYNFIKSFFVKIKKRHLLRQIQSKKIDFDRRVEHSLSYLKSEHHKKSNRYELITSRFEYAVMESCSLEIKQLDKKKNAIDELNNAIYGALGEQKVVKELEKLSDEYILINDFICSFDPPIYNRKEDDHIRSIQIDHILVSPSGIFLIETKNWSQRSIDDPNLRSPVQQIKRTNLALYILLNGGFSKGRMGLNHRWGERRIPIRNVIVFIDHKLVEEYEYVKILTLNELLGYVRYFKACFSTKETQMLANYLRNF